MLYLFYFLINNRHISFIKITISLCKPYNYSGFNPSDVILQSPGFPDMYSCSSYTGYQVILNVPHNTSGLLTFDYFYYPNDNHSYIHVSKNFMLYN